ncbi:hypothetical protein [Candidatus Binatus soli]|uniref:hypothetical protein n=1 Tax=Candidatus Binatus soli TaxID=1953413 RepID=UPI003D0D2149
MQLNNITIVRPLFLVLALTLLAGFGGSFGANATAASTPAPLSADNLNLIFVVSEDLAYQAPGDLNPATANLTNRGLQRSLRMATFLRRRVLGSKNVTGIYVLEPMTHLQTPSNYPDMAAPETIQQFALLNQITLSSVLPPEYFPYTGNSYPLNVSYAPGSVPTGVATPTAYCPNCQGLDFNDQEDNNETLVAGIVTAEVPGFYVFSAPWETTKALLANINDIEDYNLSLPASYQGPNYIYAISITPSGIPRLITYNSHVNPGSKYPALPAPKPKIGTQCTGQAPFSLDVTGGDDHAVVPQGINTNETLYIVRHADAHPLPYWSDGNYVCAGQWRALDLPNALRGKVNPGVVYSSDPAQTSLGTEGFSWSGVAPPLTVEPYAIANNLPFDLAASFNLSDENACQESSDFFFGTHLTDVTSPGLSNQTVLLGWSYQFIQPMVNSLISSYFPPNTCSQVPSPCPQAPAWPSTDYDTVWTVKLDAEGNLTVNNMKCEGIDSAKLPATCPHF